MRSLVALLLAAISGQPAMQRQAARCPRSTIHYYLEYSLPRYSGSLSSTIYQFTIAPVFFFLLLTQYLVVRTTLGRPSILGVSG
jgi:hypothetical protein